MCCQQLRLTLAGDSVKGSATETPQVLHRSCVSMLLSLGKRLVAAISGVKRPRDSSNDTEVRAPVGAPVTAARRRHDVDGDAGILGIRNESAGTYRSPFKEQQTSNAVPAVAVASCNGAPQSHGPVMRPVRSRVPSAYDGGGECVDFDPIATPLDSMSVMIAPAPAPVALLPQHATPQLMLLTLPASNPVRARQSLQTLRVAAAEALRRRSIDGPDSDAVAHTSSSASSDALERAAQPDIDVVAATDAVTSSSSRTSFHSSEMTVAAAAATSSTTLAPPSFASPLTRGIVFDASNLHTASLARRDAPSINQYSQRVAEALLLLEGACVDRAKPAIWASLLVSPDAAATPINHVASTAAIDDAIHHAVVADAAVVPSSAVSRTRDDEAGDNSVHADVADGAAAAAADRDDGRLALSPDAQADGTALEGDEGSVIVLSSDDEEAHDPAAAAAAAATYAAKRAAAAAPQPLASPSHAWIDDERLTPVADARLSRLIMPRARGSYKIMPLAGWDPTVEVGRVGSETVSASKLQCLADGEWLNDEVINFAVADMNERNKAATARLPIPSPVQLNGSGAQRLGRVHIWGSRFLTLAARGGAYDYANVARWVKTWTTDYFTSLDVIGAIVHLDVHWAAAALDLRGRSLHYYDSLSSGSSAFVSRRIRTLLAWYADATEALLGAASRVDTNDWRVVRHSASVVPQQSNAIDCGVFATAFARCISEGRPFDFTQHDIPWMRRELVLRVDDVGVELAAEAAAAAAAEVQ